MNVRTLLRGLILVVLGRRAARRRGRQTAQPASGAPPLASPAAPASQLDPIAVRSVTEAARPEEAFTLQDENWPIAEFRARLLGRTPEERAQTARSAGSTNWWRSASTALFSRPWRYRGGDRRRPVMPSWCCRPTSTFLGRVRSTAGRAAAAKSGQSDGQVGEAHSPRLLLLDALRALAGTVVALLLGTVLWWLRGRLTGRLADVVDDKAGRTWCATPGTTSGGRSRPAWSSPAASLGCLIVGLEAALINRLTFTLRQFPYTRPWGEALNGFVVATVSELGQGMHDAIPGLFSAALIVVITRVVVRLANIVFRAAEQGRLALPGVHAETAQPTRRLTVALLWIVAVVVAYPHLPGSGSDAFRGMSVLVGLMLSLGSSGLVNQVMSSFMITYSRAVRIGEFVRIGEVEGTVVHAGALATKLLTPRHEEVTVPNAVVASSTITNYSRRSGEGVFVGTAVTIGYDTPWRQVEALLLQAAARTDGLRADPAPFVLQSGLKDFYAEYQLMAALERPADLPFVLSQLHAHVQDAFNECGVQIMSPNYEADPATPKVVPREQWFAPPARPGKPRP